MNHLSYRIRVRVRVRVIVRAIAIVTTRKRERACAPARSDWLAYSKEIGWGTTDAESAFDYYESNGWKIGARPLLRIGERVPEIVRDGIKPQPKGKQTNE